MLHNLFARHLCRNIDRNNKHVPAASSKMDRIIVTNPSTIRTFQE